MKSKLLTLILLIFVSTFSAKETKFGWITDTHIGYKNADTELESIVKSINDLDEIQFVVVTGDVTETGKNSEFETAKEILDKLNKPYYIIPGNHDTKWSESGCTKFTELWNDDKFSFIEKSLPEKEAGALFIGLNSGMPWRGGGGHLAPEDLIWLEDELSKADSGTDVYFFVHHPFHLGLLVQFGFFVESYFDFVYLLVL